MGAGRCSGTASWGCNASVSAVLTATTKLLERTGQANRESGHKHLVTAIPVQQLRAGEREVGGKPPFSACAAREPNEGCESHHAPGDLALRQHPSPNCDGPIRTDNQLWRHGPGRDTFAREFRAVAARSRTKFHFSNG